MRIASFGLKVFFKIFPSSEYFQLYSNQRFSGLPISLRPTGLYVQTTLGLPIWHSFEMFSVILFSNLMENLFTHILIVEHLGWSFTDLKKLISDD